MHNYASNPTTTRWLARFLLLFVPLCSIVAANDSISESAAEELSVLIMAHRRIATVERIISHLLDYQRRERRQLAVVLAQSSEHQLARYAVEMREMWERYQGQFHSGRYVLTRHLQDDRSFSTNATSFGSKRNALQNLVHGLEEIFTGGVQSNTASVTDLLGASYAIVLEDDAVMSPDLLAFFEFARELSAKERIHRVEFATALSELRPSLLIGNRDVEALQSFRGGEPFTDARVGSAADILVGTSRTVFTTRAWGLTRHAYRRRLKPLLDAMVRFNATTQSRSAPTPDAPTASAAGSGAASAAGSGAAASSSSPSIVWRTSHPELRSCLWCNDYCYDHAIEWVLQGHRFLTPVIPRVSQGSDPGMSSAAPSTNAIFTGAPVRPSDFVVGSWRSLVLRGFPGLGISAIAPRRPRGVSTLLAPDGVARAGVFDITGILVEEPVMQLVLAMGLVLLLSLRAFGAGRVCGALAGACGCGDWFGGGGRRRQQSLQPRASGVGLGGNTAAAASPFSYFESARLKAS